MMLQSGTFVPAILIPHQHCAFWSERPVLRECTNPNRGATGPFGDEEEMNTEAYEVIESKRLKKPCYLHSTREPEVSWKDPPLLQQSSRKEPSGGADPP